MSENKKQRTRGISVESGSTVYADNNFIEGFDDGIYIDGSSRAELRNNVIKGIEDNLKDDDLDEIKKQFEDEFKKIEDVLEELKGQKNPKLIKKTLDKLSPFFAEVLLGFLKAKGYIE